MVNDDLLDYCSYRQMTLLAYSVLQAGSYTRADRPFHSELTLLENEKRLETLRAVADETGTTVSQVVLAWMLQRDILPLIAASTEAQLQENLGALDVHLSAIPGGVDAVFIMNSPDVTERIVDEAVSLGIRRVWMHNNTLMPSSASEAAVAKCRAANVNVIAVGCPMMFLKPDFFHNGMRWFIRATGRMK